MMRSLRAYLKNTLTAMARQVRARQRPDKAANEKRLRERGETVDMIRFRDLSAADIPALSAIHVRTWIETYSPVLKKGPSIQVREYQWREKFSKKDDSWFIIGVENKKGALIGFAVGQQHNHEEYKGELNKIYLLQEYHRMGIGTRLLREVVTRFQQMGIYSMVLFGIPQNPSCYFHEAMGGQRLYNKKGGFDGGYGWKNFNKIFNWEKF
jgi:L-amino acid N-acyltransferase YncA